MRGTSIWSGLLIASLTFACGEGSSDDAASTGVLKSFVQVCGDRIIEDLEQCDDGNIEPGDGCDATCRLEDPRIVITEVMSDPEPIRDGFGEWFEVHNPTANDIDLMGWQLSDTQNHAHTVTASVIVASGGYALLGRYNIPEINGNLVFDYAYGNSLVLGNQTAGITLREPSGTVIDVIVWDGGTLWPNSAGRGRSMQLGAEHDAGTVDNNNGARWCFGDATMPNGMSGTPGDGNTVCEIADCGDGIETGAEQCDDGNANNGDGCNDSCELVPVLVINEVMTHPVDAGEPAGEWFEIHNPTPYPTNLRDWRITGSGGDDHVVASDLIVVAGGYVTLGGDSNELNNGMTPVDYQYANISLADGPDSLVLLNPAGGEVDRVEWDDGTVWPDPANNGAALQFDANANPLTMDNNDGTNWCLASATYAAGGTNQGTPGAQNAPCQAPVCGNGEVDFGETCDDGNVDNGDGCDDTCQIDPILIINEIMSDPASVSDGRGEWFEIYNPTPYNIDLRDWTFSDNGGETFTVATALPVAPNGYVVLGKTTDQGLNGGIAVDYGFGNLMALANGPDAIIMRDAGGVERDRVVWDSGLTWPNPRGNGRSSQLDVNFDPFTEDNNVGSRWCRPTQVLGNGDSGSPGTANAACPVCGDGHVDAGETCDDGNLIAGDGCENDCTASPFCGDGNVDAGEICDDGNMQGGDGCEADCTLSPVCGDGVVAPTETCDDGNTVNGDGCSDQCLSELSIAILEVMQDPTSVSDSAGEWFEIQNVSAQAIDLQGWRFTDEAADSFFIVGAFALAPGEIAVLGRNANQATNGGIEVDYAYGSAMSLANLGDRIVAFDALGNETDRVVWDNGVIWPNPQGRGRSMQFDANLDPAVDDNNFGPNWCRPVSQIGNGEFGTPGLPNDACDAVGGTCGNGLPDPGETCDDGNVVSGDGCSAQCMVEAVCGDGIVAASEECDDGGRVNNDGCDRLCSLESFQQVAAEQMRTSTIAAGSNDYFFFTVDDDSFLNVESYGAGGGCSGNTRFRLYETSDLNTPIATDDNSGVGLCSLLQMAIAPGDYMLRVDHPNGQQIATYQLDFVLLVSTPSPGGAYNGAIAAGGSDLYAFANPNVGDLVISIDDGAGACPAGVDTVVQLYLVAGDNTRALVAENDDGGLNPPCSELIIEDLPVGNYYALVSGRNGSAVEPYMFNITFGAAPVCGDGTQQVGEECDDGNLVDGDGCQSDCTTAPICGDGNFDPGEECDDGNMADADGCSSTCTLETDCGNGAVEGVEQCDDGGAVPGDGCSEYCRIEARFVITEVMTNPDAVGDLQGEWFEVHNPTPNTVDLLNWSFTDEVDDNFVVDFSIEVPAGGYALLARLYDPASNGDLATDFAYGLSMKLSNQRNDRIVVRNPSGVEIDRVAYTNGTWPNPATAGRSFQFNPALDPLTADNNVGSNWCRPTTQMSNGDFGTPAAANDPCPAP